MPEPIILPATMREWNKAVITPDHTTWFAKVVYEDEFGETEYVYFKFVRAYEVKISDFYSLDKTRLIKQINIV